MTAPGATLGTAYIQIQADVDRFAQSLQNGLRKLAGVAVAFVAFKKLQAIAESTKKTLLLTFASLAGAAFAGAAVGKILALSGALLQLTGVAAALPAALAVGGAAIAGLLVATKGLGEAFGAAFKDAAAFEKAIENLSPRAKDLAREFQSIVPQLKNIKNAAQDAFAGELLGQIASTVKALEGPLSAGLAKVARRYGEIAAAALEFARSQQSVAFLDQLFSSTEAALDGIAQALAPLLSGFMNATLAILPMFEQLGQVAGGALAEFGDWLTRVAQDGRLVEWLNNAMSVFGDLFGLIVGVGEVLMLVLGAGAEQGASLLQFLNEAVSTFADWLRTAEGASVLTDLFAALGALASGLAPVVINVLSALGPVLAAIAPAVQAIVPVLVQLSEVLGPALEAIAGPLGVALLAVVNAASTLVPYLIPIGEAIGALLTVIGPLIDSLVWLVEPFQPLVEVLKELVLSLAPIAEVLGPVLMQLFTAIGDAAAPILGGLVRILSALAEPVGRLIAALAGLLMPIFEAIAPIIDAVVDVLLSLLPLIVDLIDPLVAIVTALTPVVAVLAAFLGAALQLLSPVIQLVVAVLRLILIKPILSLIELLATLLGLLLKPLEYLLIPLDEFTRFMETLDFESLFAQVDQVPALLEEAGRKLMDFLSGLWDSIWEDASAAFTDGIDRIVAIAMSLPELLVSLPGKMLDLGVSIIRSFTDGIRSRVGDIGGSVIGALRGFVNGVVISRLNSVIQTIDNILPGSLPRIPLLADGDIIRKPTLAGIGEDGAEAVIPLTRPRRAMELLEASGLADLVRGAGGIPQILVRVFLGDREITDIVRVEVDSALDSVAENVLAGART